MNAKTMIRKAEVARRQVRHFGPAQALSARNVLELRAGALQRLRPASFQRDLNAEKVAAKAVVAREQLRRG